VAQERITPVTTADTAQLAAAFADASEARVRDALSAVLDMHRPISSDWGRMCSCWARGGSRNAWPCPEMVAIVATLEGVHHGILAEAAGPEGEQP
jgi:hypothetical protein